MSREEREPTIQRILVALDSSPASLEAVDTAAELAAGFGAELIGLFVEDVNLLRIAEISFTQEVGFFSAKSRQLEIRHVKRQFRSQASRARQALQTAVAKAQVDWSFRVARGDIAAELLSAALEADLVILGRMGWSPIRRKLGSTARAILTRGSQLTLLLHPGIRLGESILVLYNGSTVSQKALSIASQLVPETNGRLSVLILAEDRDTAQRLQQEAQAWLEERQVQGRYLWRVGIDIQALARAVQTERCRTLVLPGSGLLLENEAVLSLLDRIACSVLLVR